MGRIISEMETDHLHNAIAYHERKVRRHAEQVEALKAELKERRRQHRGPKMQNVGYAAVFQGGKLVHFRGDWDEYAKACG